MPRPRFYKLSLVKRERILESAAKAFAAHGYEGASLNHILAEAGISKGAAYYYFDDKADLYVTTVVHFSQELMADSAYNPDQVAAESFWDEIAALYRQQFTSYIDRPWVFGVVKSAGSLPADLLEQEALSEMWEQAQLTLAQLMQHGRTLGVIREDLPEELLVSLVMAVDDAHDRWLFAHWSQLSQADLEEAATRITDMLRRLLAP